MWEIQIVEVKSSPSSAFKEGKTSRRRRLEMQLALNSLRLYLNLVCLQLLFILERTSKFVVQQFYSIVGFFKTHLFSIVIFSQKYLLPAFQPVTLSSFSNTERRIQKSLMHIKQVNFVFSKQEENISSRSSSHFCSKI